MYQLSNIQKHGLEFLELKNSDNSSSALISLEQGGSLQELVLDKTQIIANIFPLTYEDTYASAILFPFANRVKNGEYTYNNKTYKFNCNEKDRNNALHGLVYNKKFEYIDKKLTTENGSVTLCYEYDGDTEGFPFKYDMTLVYELSNNAINISVEVQNRSQYSFPFTIGWHPYFVSNDLYNSHLSFESTKKVQFDNQQITSDILEQHVKNPYNIKDKQLDDAYVLNTNEIDFTTPEYGIKISSSSQDNFLQLYTPDLKTIIAIEPMTGIADSLNNKIGLQTLNAGNDYKINWKIKIND